MLNFRGVDTQLEKMVRLSPNSWDCLFAEIFDRSLGETLVLKDYLFDVLGRKWSEISVLH